MLRTAAKLLFVGVGVAAIMAVANTRRTVRNELTARVIRVRLGKMRFEGNRLKVAVIISNPTSENIIVRSVVGEVYLNGKKVGNVETFDKVDVLPNQKTTLYLDVRLMAPQLISVYADLLNSKKIAIEIGLTGTINVNNLATPFQVNYKMF